MPRYKYYKSDNKVIALSSFAGKAVKGVAKCDPTDTFSEEFGEKLAAARCNNKVAAKRVKCAKNKLNAALNVLVEAEKQVAFMEAYYNDALRRFDDSEQEVLNLLNN